MKDSAARLRRRLKKVGLSDLAIDAAWPAWWSADADASSSTQAELRFSIARKLGLDPHSLLEDGDEPRFVWREGARFKHLSVEGDRERTAITSFAAAFGSTVVAATPAGVPIDNRTAVEIRDAVLRKHRYINLQTLLGLCWGAGIPVAHLQVFPYLQKRMFAVTVRVGDRHAILLSKDSQYPAPIAFYVAHELAHIALGHLERTKVLVDFGLDDLEYNRAEPPGLPDREEIAADEYALQLLTGEPRPTVLTTGARPSARGLAQVCLDASDELRIDPGTLALCFGYSSGNWKVANGSLKFIYSSTRSVSAYVNDVALHQLSLERMPDDARSYLRAVLGGIK